MCTFEVAWTHGHVDVDLPSSTSGAYELFFVGEDS